MTDSPSIDVDALDNVAPPPSPAAVESVRNRSNSAILGDVAWLMMESSWHRSHRVEDFARLVMPPIGQRQFRLYHHANIPVAFFSWACLSSEAESRFLADPSSLQAADWTSGDAIYLVDFVASKGAVRKVGQYLRRDPLLAGAPVRGLKMRNNIHMLIEIAATANGRRIRATRLDA
jgi:hemolysin-activating ACP:hemolysin acyltransferase